MVASNGRTERQSVAVRVIRIKEESVRVIDRSYIGGEFVQPHGTELFDLHNPTTGKVIGRVKLGDEEDARRAIAAAKRAFPSFSRTSKEDRLAMLRKLSDVVARNADALIEAAVKEFGGPVTAMVQWMKYAPQGFLAMAEALERFEFTRRIKSAEVVMEPIGEAWPLFRNRSRVRHVRHRSTPRAEDNPEAGSVVASRWLSRSRS